jgi:hypothetical protein
MSTWIRKTGLTTAAQALGSLGGKALAKRLSEAEVPRSPASTGSEAAAERCRIAKLAVAARDLPALNRCKICGTPWTREQSLSLGRAEMVIQGILRHPNVSTTATRYIKSAPHDVKHAMEKLEINIPQGGQL